MFPELTPKSWTPIQLLGVFMTRYDEQFKLSVVQEYEAGALGFIAAGPPVVQCDGVKTAEPMTCLTLPPRRVVESVKLPPLPPGRQWRSTVMLGPQAIKTTDLQGFSGLHRTTPDALLVRRRDSVSFVKSLIQMM